MWRDYQAVLWDFDGVIVDTEWSIYEAWLAIYRREGVESKLSREVYVQCIGSDFETWSPETYLESLTGKAYDWEEEGRVRNLEIRKRLEGEQVNEGVVECWEAMRCAGLKLAVVSSSSHSWVDGWLEKLGLLSYLDAVVCRGDAPRIKPAPDLYLEGARRVGFPAANCLVIEDSLNGMKSAHSAGCDCVVVPSQLTEVLDFSAASKVVENFSDLLHL